jgi:hypothetical protein
MKKRGLFKKVLLGFVRVQPTGVVHVKKQRQRSTPFREIGSRTLRGQHTELLGADGIIRGESFRIKPTLVIDARGNPASGGTPENAPKPPGVRYSQSDRF